MSEQPLIATIPAPETNIEHLIAKVPALEVKLDVPSVEQVQANDEVFRRPSGDGDNAAGLIGMIGGMMLLHDVAVENMHDVDDLEGHLQRDKREEEEDEDED